MSENKMPVMPSLNKSEDAKGLASSSPGPEVGTEGDASGLEELATPDHKPSTEPFKIQNDLKTIAISKGIEVVALRKGFYNQHRVKEGEKFIIKKFEELGEWMKCCDPDLQKKHVAYLESKKAKQ